MKSGRHKRTDRIDHSWGGLSSNVEEENSVAATTTTPRESISSTQPSKRDFSLIHTDTPSAAAPALVLVERWRCRAPAARRRAIFRGRESWQEG